MIPSTWLRAVNSANIGRQNWKTLIHPRSQQSVLRGSGRGAECKSLCGWICSVCECELGVSQHTQHRYNNHGWWIFSVKGQQTFRSVGALARAVSLLTTCKQNQPWILSNEGWDCSPLIGRGCLLLTPNHWVKKINTRDTPVFMSGQHCLVLSSVILTNCFVNSKVPCRHRR